MDPQPPEEIEPPEDKAPEAEAAEESAGAGEDESTAFLLDVPGSKPKFDYLRMGAGIMSGLVIVGIVLFSLTDLSSVVLPMDDRYLDVLIPATADGSEPFTLNELNHELEEKTLSVAGWMTNRSEVEVENVIAVITARETTGRFPATLEIPVDPGLIPPDGTGMFSMTVTLREKPNNYSIRFKLENGPFVPHRDERALQFGIRPP